MSPALTKSMNRDGRRDEFHRPTENAEMVDSVIPSGHVRRTAHPRPDEKGPSSRWEACRPEGSRAQVTRHWSPRSLVAALARDDGFERSPKLFLEQRAKRQGISGRDHASLPSRDPSSRQASRSG